LSEEQKSAVLSKARYNRIVAGAGAGKTETLTRRIAYLLLVERTSPSSIVAFTFTEKAAKSIKSRIYSRIEEISGANATANLGEMYVGTIHAYAKRILEDHFMFGNHGVLDDNQEIAFLMRHGWSLGIQTYGKHYAEGCRNFLRTVNMVWGEMLDEKVLKERAPEFYAKLEKYENLLIRHKQLTFGRMIYEAVINLRSAPNALQDVKHLLVDEYQDINQAQQELIDLIGKNSSIFIVGDPRQSIYQWRGSDERFFDGFSKKSTDMFEVAIRENRRSARRIVRNANTFAESLQKAHYEPMTPVRHEEGFIGLSSHDQPENEAKWIAEQIEVLMAKNKSLKFSDIGVLTRSVSTSAEPLLKEFKSRRIPYIVGGKVGLFKRDEALAVGKIFVWFCKNGFWVENPWNWSEKTTGDMLLDRALTNWTNAHDHGYPNDSVGRLRRLKDDLNSDRPSYDNFTAVFHAVLGALGFERLDYRTVNDAAVIANLGRFNSLLTDYETANRLGGRTPHWNNDLQGLCWYINSHAIQAYEEQPSDDIRNIEAVQVMTIHQAKGLEWPIVFLFATVNTRFPPVRVGRAQYWCEVPREMFDATRYEGSVEDERKLFYVATTRAKDALLITYFRRLNRKVDQSEFIADMDKSVTTTLIESEGLPALIIHPSSLPEELETFSAGDTITYDICPYMYLLQRIWGYQPGLNQAIGFGNSLHYCLRRAGELIKVEGVEPCAAATKSVEESFHIPFVGGAVFDYFKNSAKKILAEFSKKYAEDMKRIEEVEYRLEYPIQNATIMGKVDVILREGGEMEVRDYKTSEEARTFEEASVQVRMYAAGLKSLGRPITKGSIAYLEEQQVRMVDASDQMLEGSRRFAERVVQRIADRDFAPNPGPNCNRCDQAPICRWRNKLVATPQSDGR